MKVAIVFLFLSLNAIAASPEGQERGGGKQIELDFVEMAQVGVRSISLSQSSGSGDFQGFDVAAFVRAMEVTQVSALPHLCETKIDLNTGGEKSTCLDARYLPEENKIELSEREWRVKKCLDQVALAVHEYGRASGNENGNYRYSSRVKRSSHLIAACDGVEGDRNEKCATNLGYLSLSLDDLVRRFKEGNMKDPSRRDRTLVDIENALENWRSVNPAFCSERANYYCLEKCTYTLGSGCFSACR